MDCKQVEKMIPQFLDDDLTTEELREFMEHIENCTDCKEELTIEFLVSEGLVRLENGAVFDLQRNCRSALRLQNVTCTGVKMCICFYIFWRDW